MEAGPATHPSDKTLSSYRSGQLDRSQVDTVKGHLNECARCRSRVAGVTSESTVGRRTFAPVRPESPPPVGSSLEIPTVRPTEPTPPPLPSSLPPGLAEHPDYEILRELGRGGMGVVYLAENTLMARKEVLKVVSAHLLNRKGVAERFLREIRSAAQLHHANIVTAYSASRIGESIVFSMEYVEGYDLASLVEKNGPLAVAHACNFIYQTALGLQHAHERGMVHRDIKPSNLMLAREGNKPVIKILDFGLAKVTSEGAVDGGLTRDGQMLGTPHYVSPEQTINAQKADIRADIYSLGCTLYCLLTGQPPFDAPSLYELLQAHHSIDAKPLNLIRPEVSEQLAAVVAKMLAKEPECRYQTPADVAQALVPFFKKARSDEKTATQPRSNDSTPPSAFPAASEPVPAWQTLVEVGEKTRPLEGAETAQPSRQRTPTWIWPALVVSCSGLVALVVFSLGGGAGGAAGRASHSQAAHVPGTPRRRGAE